MTDSYYPVEALNTIRASYWTLIFAELFGKKTTVKSFGKNVKMSAWRGKTYMLNSGNEEQDND